ncbi:MAG: archaemetzincin family Zn-dependent metalloprotease [Chloroflexi bacterium]|nr:archaemetzincin family Zn-dependent metalloprotease [Chloroflexota bacterium]MBM3154144.1 archaemetzincin family Zn-dependent metalloprotease [Chloroflexota bacterium]MBM3172226.1 archaemetzincin family Zn-dependent metalloprotease [Chloroflexota bacterium]MBM3174725.1 archaemetzincin family Zn-dependent metalloprotease [Chloroflexota bacterium]MBM4450346.1 archaemetzincin family Zn-dependent metalloprotease [Chloroflexota bacterium]
MKIILKSIGRVEPEAIWELKERLKQTFGCPVETKAEFGNLEQAYDPKRKQYLASKLLDCFKKSGVAEDEKVLGIVSVDLYAPDLNFVFGQADVDSGVAVISLHRLKPSYYGSSWDKAIFLDRAAKEAIHELGHTFGLGHCPDSKCVMHFSNSLADTDHKHAVFCGQCRPKLIK